MQMYAEKTNAIKVCSPLLLCAADRAFKKGNLKNTAMCFYKKTTRLITGYPRARVLPVCIAYKTPCLHDALLCRLNCFKFPVNVFSGTGPFDLDYSGKKKQHSLKTELCIDSQGPIVSLSKSYPGSKHDFAMPAGSKVKLRNLHNSSRIEQ